jgi:hypothetical protein
MVTKDKKKKLNINEIYDRYIKTELISAELAEKEPRLIAEFAIQSNLLRMITYTKYTANIEQYSNAKQITKFLDNKEKEIIKLWNYLREKIVIMTNLYGLATPLSWLRYSHDTGKSSETIYHVLCETRDSRFTPDIPYDPSDFGRCYRFLRVFPHLKRDLHEVSDRFIMWKPYVENWDKLTTLYEEEMLQIKAPKLFDYMNELEEQSKILDGWIKTGNNSWTKEIKQ